MKKYCVEEREEKKWREGNNVCRETIMSIIFNEIIFKKAS